MANEEHVRLLLDEDWNEWREQQLQVHPDLSGADLDSADLSSADLSSADLSSADLGGANLRGANLRDANLRDAYLNRANLLDADLGSADLSNADLSGAQLGGTGIGNVDLCQVEGLKAVDHRGPSTIGTNTLERSHGQIPHAFLKGCGLADWQIENAKLFDSELDTDQRTTIMYEMERVRGEQALHWFRVFISYARSDEAFVEAIEELFDEKGVRYWRDAHDLKAGRLERQIDRAIDLNPLVLLVLSERSVESDWVEHEAARARELECRYREQGRPQDVLCPVRLDDAWQSCDWERRLRRQIEKYNILDFSRWTNAQAMMAAFAKLYEGVILNYRPKGSPAGPARNRAPMPMASR